MTSNQVAFWSFWVISSMMLVKSFLPFTFSVSSFRWSNYWVNIVSTNIVEDVACTIHLCHYKSNYVGRHVHNNWSESGKHWSYRILLWISFHILFFLGWLPKRWIPKLLAFVRHLIFFIVEQLALQYSIHFSGTSWLSEYTYHFKMKQVMSMFLLPVSLIFQEVVLKNKIWGETVHCIWTFDPHTCPTHNWYFLN